MLPQEVPLSGVKYLYCDHKEALIETMMPQVKGLGYRLKKKN